VIQPHCRSSLLVIAVLLAGVTPAWGQRIQFPSPLQGTQVAQAAPGSPYPANPTYPTNPTYPPAQPYPGYPAGATAPATAAPPPGATAPQGYYNPPAIAPPATGYTTPAPSTAVAPAPGVAPASPYLSPAPGQTFPSAAPWPGAGGTAPPVYGQPTYGPTPVPGAAPTATLPGTILPPPNWDPYAAPGTQQPGLFPGDPFMPPPAVPAYGQPQPTQRLLQELRAEYLWMAGNAYSDFGYNQADLSATFAVPFFYNQQNPFLITPGFTTYFLSCPTVDAPHQLYDAYLDTAWNPQFSPWLGAELGFRVGVYSDFQRVTSDAIRYTGHALAVMTLSPTVQLKAGAVYLDRVRIKILPAGGLVWTPNADVRFDILFPNPKISRRFTTYGITDWWIYLRGEYGGDSWSVHGAWIDTGFVSSTNAMQMDYNDIRAALGLEFMRHGGVNGLVEAGVAFDREVRSYPSGPANFYPATTYFLRGSIAF